MRRLLYCLIALLVLPSLLVNLGLVIFIDDEAIRALVAQEMLWSGNFIAPTMHADAYLNKPPLWNWLLALSFTLHGEATEWSARLPTVVCLLGFAATVWYWSRKYFSNWLAVVHALTLITCGRMLFWDSMLALIDTCFSWVVYVQIMVLYHYGRRGDWWRAFLLSYLLTATGFMLKNLPAIVFQGLSVFAILTWTKSWRQFLRPAHLVSGLLCVAILGLYYWSYSAYVNLEWVIDRLFIESGKRTVVAHSLWESVSHVLSFPFEMWYHFLPWTFLVVFLLLPGAWARLKTNDFAAFSLFVFVFNIPVYWLSPEVYPRYLLMLFPLLFGSCLYLYSIAHERARTAGARVYLDRTLIALMVLIAPVPFIAPFLPRLDPIAYLWPKALACGTLLSALAYLAIRSWPRNLISHISHLTSPPSTLLILATFLLALRLTFNFFVLPIRATEDDRGIPVRQTAHAVATTPGPLAIYGFTLIEPATGFYLTQARGDFVRRQWESFDSTTTYILNPGQYPDVRIVPTQDSLWKRHLRVHYPVGRLPDPPRGRAPLNFPLRDGMGTGF